MTRLRPRTCLTLLIAIVMALGMVMSAIHVSAGHSVYAVAQAEAVRHAQLAAEIAQHGHTHEEGDDEERLPGHVHGHNTTDHVNETAGHVPALPTLAPPRSTRSVPRLEPVPAPASQPGGLERPPRSVVA